MESFWAHPMVLLGDVCLVEAYFGPFGASVNLGARQVHGSVCVEHTIDSKIILDAPDGTAR
jgi:hypothetical protein